MPMFNAVHPGRILRTYMASDITVTSLAAHIGVSRPLLSNVLNGKGGISAAMALKLAAAFPNSDARFWINLQTNYELSRAQRAKRRAIKPVRAMHPEALPA